ncbi:hypothetical protein Y5S_00699 [Alcanivorax nanhaiticus]|uniref:Lipoprotein n=1 Tax=Alcanivorax nanhaiticus TaxID=1177154 RepID=A0A095SNS9_9GAMM|nr:hypothetical protein [Alcanivorax nanhaiticus]KGD66227.1 hypothetical protein Y5S_00699 [Alcanivorax nanhaiticus]
MKSLFSVSAVACAIMLSGCANKEVNETATPDDIKLPVWVLNPPNQEQFVGTDCMAFNGNMNITKQASSANSRLELANQIGVAVDGLAETMANRTGVGNGETAEGSDFTSVSEQLTQQSLNGSVLEAVDFGTIEGKTQLCTMWVLNGERSKALFKNLVKASGASLNAQDEDVLYQKFLSSQARERLDAARNRSN